MVDSLTLTVITVCLNSEKTIEKCIKSVLSQKSENVEFIVIDGGSSDKTIEIINRYADSIDVVIIESDEGIYDAWNKGLRNVSGDFIAFLGSDDIYLPGALKIYESYINDNPATEYVSSLVRYGQGKSSRVVGRAWNWDQFCRYMTVAHVGSFHSAQLFKSYGQFDTGFRITGDYEFLLRCGPDLNAGFVPQITVEMGVGGVSSGNQQMVFDEALRAKRMHTNLSSLMLNWDKNIAKVKFYARQKLLKAIPR